MDKIKKLEDERITLLEESDEILDQCKNDEGEIRSLTTSEKKSLEKNEKRIKEVDDLLKPLYFQEKRKMEIAKKESRSPNIISGNTTYDPDENGIYWKDQKGKEVRVYRPNERISENSRKPEVRLGAILRLMMTGQGNEVERRVLAEGTDSAGGYTVPTILMNDWIDRLRTKVRVVQSGARTIPLESDKNTMAKLLTDPTATWRNENATVNVDDATFGAVTFAAKSLAVIVTASREVVQDSINIEEILERSFAESFAEKIDFAALLGSGTDPEPLGIANYTNVNEVDMGTNGAAITSYAPLIAAVQKLKESNAEDPQSFIMAPRTWGALTGLVDSNNQPLQRPGSIADIPYLDTNSIPIDQTHGTAIDASTIITGNFSELVIGVRQSMRIELLRETYAANYQFGFLAHLRADVQPMHEESFVKISGIIP